MISNEIGTGMICRKRSALTSVMLFMFTMALFLVCVKPTEAANIKKAKPKFVTASCWYTGKSVNLTWKKVKGAKKYVVYRSTKKNGKYKKFATTKKLTISKEAQGEFYYKVKAMSGKKASKFSSPVHIFAASGNIYNSVRYGTTMYIGGYAVRGNTTSYYYSLMQNYSKKTMAFKANQTCTFYQFNPTTREMKQLETGTFGDAVTIQPGKTGTFTVKAGYPTVETGTVLVIEIPFTSGGQTFKLYIAREAVNTWVTAITK